MSTYLQMLCRYFKPSKVQALEHKLSAGGELAVFDFLNNRPLERSFKATSVSATNLGKNRLLNATHRIGQLACLVSFSLSPLSAQTLNAVQLASLGKVQDVSASTKYMEPQQLLQNEARHWMAKQLSLSAEQVQIADMDARLKVQTCPSGTVFDHPFANRQVIRARCENPACCLLYTSDAADE